MTQVPLSPPPRAPIPVVCALIERDGLILVAQRPPAKHLPLKWEFPGGKVEAGESPQAAIVRELREELGCETHVVRGLPRVYHDYGTALIEMIPFVCALTPGTPEPHAIEHVSLRWVLPAEIGDLDLAPADFPVLASYASATSS